MDKPMELWMKHLAKLNFQYGQITISSTLFHQTKALDLTAILRTCAIERNKRCLIAYHMKRLEKIKQLRWELGPVIPSHIRQGNKINIPCYNHIILYL